MGPMKSKMQRVPGLTFREAGLKFAVLAIVTASTACHGKLETQARASASAPAAPVSVAQPVTETVIEASDYTGRAEACAYPEPPPRPPPASPPLPFPQHPLLH